jgi:hypothetical protein
MSSNSVSALSLTDITTQSFISITDSAAYRISISPTNCYSGDRADLDRSFGTAFPLIVHQDLKHRILTIIEEPTFPIIRGMTYYYAVDEPSVQFNFEGRCGISHDAVLLFRADGWIVVVPDKWFGKIGKRLCIKRVLGYLCLPSQF